MKWKFLRVLAGPSEQYRTFFILCSLSYNKVLLSKAFQFQKLLFDVAFQIREPDKDSNSALWRSLWKVEWLSWHKNFHNDLSTSPKLIRLTWHIQECKMKYLLQLQGHHILNTNCTHNELPEIDAGLTGLDNTSGWSNAKILINFYRWQLCRLARIRGCHSVLLANS